MNALTLDGRPSPELLPLRVLDQIDFDGPIPPAPLRPIATPCWLWKGWHNDQGYAYVRWDGRDQPAHRVLFEVLTGQSLDELDRDHVCRVVACIRPDHGEAVTHAENMRRIREHQTSCRREGHDWTDPRNVRIRPNGSRYCAECDRQAQVLRYARRKGQTS